MKDKIYLLKEVYPNGFSAVVWIGKDEIVVGECKSMPKQVFMQIYPEVEEVAAMVEGKME